MNYLKFKKLYHGSVHGMNENKHLSVIHSLDCSFETQSLFDFIFDELIKSNTSIPPIPFWAMDYYNDFIRILEDETFTVLDKTCKIKLLRINLVEQASEIIGKNSIDKFLASQKAA